MRILPDNRNKLNDLVFENRNQAYGAYALRKDQDKRTLMGFLFACSLFVLAGAGMKFMNSPIETKTIVSLLDQEDSLITVIFENQIEPPKDQLEKPKNSITKTDPGTNYVAAKKDADTIRTVADVRNLVIGPKQDDTTGTRKVGLGNTSGNPPKDPIDTVPVISTAIMPQFDGDFLSYVKDKTIYPQMAKDNGIEGTVHVNFVVDQNGEVTNVKILNPTANALLKKEALRVFGKIPKWTPGSDGTRNVRVSMTVPMKFKLK